MPAFNAILIGHDTLTRECGQMVLDAGNTIRCVVTRSDAVRDWALAAGLTVQAPGGDLPEADWILSIANLDVLRPEVLTKARRGAVNFHDGPLPRYAGLNAPVWAILNGEARHGISWHLIEGGVDEGRVLEQRLFDIAADETALSLNGKCFAAALESFPAVVAQLQDGLRAIPQDLSQRSYFARDARPPNAGRIDFAAPTQAILRLVRALDHGDYPNPLLTVKILAGGRFLSVGKAEPTEGSGTPGTVLRTAPAALTVATGDGAVRLSRLRDPSGQAPALPAEGTVLPGPDGTEDEALARAVRDEGHWRKALRDLAPADLPALGGALAKAPLAQEFALDGLAPDAALARFAAMIAEGDDRGAVDLALAVPGGGLLSDRVPVRFAGMDGFPDALSAARGRTPYPADLTIRLGGQSPTLRVALSDRPGDGLLKGTGLTFAASEGRARLTACPDQISPAAFALIAARLAHRLAGGSGLSQADKALIAQANATAVAVAPACIHDLIATQAARTPAAPALTCEDRTLTYAQVDSAANRLAHRLIAAGVGPGQPVGLFLRRSEWLVIAALAIWKAGGAYVPLDPAYPADRIALYVQDSGAAVIVTDATMEPQLPPHAARIVRIEGDGPMTAPEPRARPDDLAYLIYTSGSTGRPKGVMIEHRQVANFLAGMDARIAHEPPGTWLAVTSLSFDISVLELFWTLARGFRVVVAGDEDRTMVAKGRIGTTGRGMEFSLYYWGNDDGIGRDKYKLLLEGAKFADENGFCAVWTPERHFHAFGGPYPNPAVTGAAVAAITRNLSVRSGSVVAPLHHPVRIAEDWAVIDNLTNGRAGLAVASGWHPDDFVLRPENAPPDNKAAMFRAVEDVRKLWRGEALEYDMPHGRVTLRSQPRPVSAEVPIWVTIAGNPDTWREAGTIGAHVLTHLLGQSIGELTGKIAIYHEALRAAGHDPKDFKVSLMLHTYLAETREAARAAAKKPMQDYLLSAAGLIKQYAWAFPAFKRPRGMTSPGDLDLRELDPEVVQAILDFAFDRYFEESGLFGTIEDALDRVEQLKRIGIGEIACLIDYGIDKDTVLGGLAPLAQVLHRANAGDDLAEDDFSLAAQIVRHGVTHLQCTPSMARMLVTNDDSRAALARVRHLLVGGEALPGSLVADLRAASGATISNMYGPTETTIWSTTAAADAAEATGPVGTPIANTQVHVLDAAMAEVAPGVAGELWIGGDGVARGYWQRPDLTAERFVSDPARGRLYRTGDLARWRADGGLDFLGRADHQVKLRGYRIELGEIEAALDAQPGIRQSVVLAREDVPGVVQLVGYVLADVADEAALKAALARVLPPHMVPARIVRLDALPLTPNRKIDRKALPAPAASARPVAPAAPAAARAAPSAATAAMGAGDTQRRIAEIWSRILGVDAIGPRDSFFDLGGHSLLAVQAHRDIRDGLGARHVTITDIFRFPTLAALAARVDAGFAPAAPVPEPEPALAGADTRSDAMARRRELRARRGGDR